MTFKLLFSFFAVLPFTYFQLLAFLLLSPFYIRVDREGMGTIDENLIVRAGEELKITCNMANCAAKVVASVCRDWTFLSRSAIYLIFRSFDREADCLFAQILLHVG